MIDVVEATPSEVGALIHLEAVLFVEDAGRPGPFSDPTWPEREGREDLDSSIDISHAPVSPGIVSTASAREMSRVSLRAETNPTAVRCRRTGRRP